MPIDRAKFLATTALLAATSTGLMGCGGGEEKKDDKAKAEDKKDGDAEPAEEPKPAEEPTPAEEAKPAEAAGETGAAAAGETGDAAAGGGAVGDNDDEVPAPTEEVPNWD